jgi:hypothetical protein
MSDLLPRTTQIEDFRVYYVRIWYTCNTCTNTCIWYTCLNDHWGCRRRIPYPYPDTYNTRICMRIIRVIRVFATDTDTDNMHICIRRILKITYWWQPTTSLLLLLLLLLISVLTLPKSLTSKLAFLIIRQQNRRLRQGFILLLHFWEPVDLWPSAPYNSDRGFFLSCRFWISVSNLKLG